MTEHKYIKENGALINKDDSEYQSYVKQRARMRAAKAESNVVTDKVATLEAELAAMKEMMLKLMEK